MKLILVDFPSLLLVRTSLFFAFDFHWKEYEKVPMKIHVPNIYHNFYASAHCRWLPEALCFRVARPSRFCSCDTWKLLNGSPSNLVHVCTCRSDDDHRVYTWKWPVLAITKDLFDWSTSNLAHAHMEVTLIWSDFGIMGSKVNHKNCSFSE